MTVSILVYVYKVTEKVK